jgi:hypothetical protein
MRAIVAGGRHEFDGPWVWAELDRIDAERRIDVVIEGGQREWRYDPAIRARRMVGGVDYHASTWGEAHQRPVVRVKADWDRFGKGAGPIRNRIMLERHAPDVLIAFPGGTGTADITRRARHRGIEVITVTRSET